MSRALPNWLDAYLEYTSNTEPPLMYRVWAGISVLAACLQRRCRIQMGFKRFYPNFYVVLVGPPGKCRKGGAMEPAIQLLRDSGVKLVADSITREQLIDRLQKAQEVEPVLGSTEVVMHASLSVFSPELGVFLGDYDEKFINALIAWYDCQDHWEYDTKHQGTYAIDGVWFNLLGATTPIVLQEKFGRIVLLGGLTSRMVFVNEMDRDRDEAEPELSEEQLRLGELLLQDMVQLRSLGGVFKRTDEFRKAYRPWYNDQRNNPPFTELLLAPYCERRAQHALKLSMISSASKSNNMIITEADFLWALSILERTELKMPYAFKGVGMSELVTATNKVIEILEGRKKITKAELLRLIYHDISEHTLEAVLDQMESMGYIKRLINTETRQSILEWIGELK